MQCPACRHVWEPPTEPLTVRQRQVLDYILLVMATKRVAPTLQEIAAHFEFRSLSTVHEHLQTLERKGWIAKGFGLARSITAVTT